jgi:hypothetical protein
VREKARVISLTTHRRIVAELQAQLTAPEQRIRDEHMAGEIRANALMEDMNDLKFELGHVRGLLTSAEERIGEITAERERAKHHQQLAIECERAGGYYGEVACSKGQDSTDRGEVVSEVWQGGYERCGERFKIGECDWICILQKDHPGEHISLESTQTVASGFYQFANPDAGFRVKLTAAEQRIWELEADLAKARALAENRIAVMKQLDVFVNFADWAESPNIALEPPEMSVALNAFVRALQPPASVAAKETE